MAADEAPAPPAGFTLAGSILAIDAAALAAHVSGAIAEANDSTPTPPAMNREYKRLVSQVNAQAASLVKTSDAVGEYSSALLKVQDAGVSVPQS